MAAEKKGNKKNKERLVNQTLAERLFGLTMLALACGACATAPQQNSALSAAPVEKTSSAPARGFPPPNVMFELCSSDVQAHTIGKVLYWVQKDQRPSKVQKGMASWYGNPFHGRKTANGEIYDMYAISAAHKNLPLPSLALVTNLKNGKSIVVRINDRGPFYKRRIIDLSYSAAQKINMVEDGVVPVKVQSIGVPIREDALPDYFNWPKTN